MKLYRGTQNYEVEGYSTATSWTPSLPVAVIWSSRPPDVWSSREATFLPSSTIHIGELKAKKILQIAEHPYVTFGDILRELRFKKRGGIDLDAALKILRYMHKRLIGRIKGGDFLYKVRGEEWEDLDEADLPLSFSDPMTLISEFRDEFEDRADEDFADRLQADTYVFADAPALQEAARQQGYDAILYSDVFQGGSYSSEKLLGLPAEDMQYVEMDLDIEDDEVPVHDTYRPLMEGAVVEVESVPTKTLLDNVPLDEMRRV